MTEEYLLGFIDGKTVVLEVCTHHGLIGLQMLTERLTLVPHHALVHYVDVLRLATVVVETPDTRFDITATSALHGSAFRLIERQVV